MRGWTREDMTLRGPAALHVSWPSMRLNRSKDAKPKLADQERQRDEALEELADLVAEARVYVNAALTHTLPIAASESRDVVLSFDSDSFVTVEVEGEADEIYSVVAPRFTPFAFTNPIFVDADGDGVCSAPGLPDELPPSITAPLADLATERDPEAQAP